MDQSDQQSTMQSEHKRPVRSSEHCIIRSFKLFGCETLHLSGEKPTFDYTQFMKNTQIALVRLTIGMCSCMAVAAQPESTTENTVLSPVLSHVQEKIESIEQARPTLLLVDDAAIPSVEVRWVANRELLSFTGTMPYTAPTGGENIGKNVKCYVALGGTRIETGAGHPKGAVIRLGVTKVDGNRAFFAGIDPKTEIEFTITGVRFNQPVKYHQGTGMMHLSYALGDLKACALPGTARNQYLLSDPDDTLGGRVVAGVNATPGALDGQETNGKITIEVDEFDPTLVTMFVRVPFGLLRHLQDPWESDLPGTFFEPIHMHAEAEMIPIDVKPLDRDPIVPEVNIVPDESSQAAEEEREFNED